MLQHDITYPTIYWPILEVNKRANTSTFIFRHIRDQFCNYVSIEGAMKWLNEI